MRCRRPTDRTLRSILILAVAPDPTTSSRKVATRDCVIWPHGRERAALAGFLRRGSRVRPSQPPASRVRALCSPPKNGSDLLLCGMARARRRARGRQTRADDGESACRRSRPRHRRRQSGPLRPPFVHERRLATADPQAHHTATPCHSCEWRDRPRTPPRGYRGRSSQRSARHPRGSRPRGRAAAP